VSGNDRAAWELQWQPAGGGRTRHLVLGRQGLRNPLLALGVIGMLLVGGGLLAGRDWLLTHRAIGAARFENDILRARQDALRERATSLPGRLEAFEVESAPVSPSPVADSGSAGRR
jgi:hypothetical protein